MGDKQDKQRSEADAEFEREIREGRKFTLAEAIGRLAGVVAFSQQKVGPLRGFSADRLQSLVEGSCVASFKANEVIMHQGRQPRILASC